MDKIPAADLAVGDVIITGPTPESRAIITDARLHTDGWLRVWLRTPTGYAFETAFDVEHDETVLVDGCECGERCGCRGNDGRCMMSPDRNSHPW